MVAITLINWQTMSLKYGIVDKEEIHFWQMFHSLKVHMSKLTVYFDITNLVGNYMVLMN